MDEPIYEKTVSRWKRPWNYTQDDWKNLENKDDRFFSSVMKGLLSYLNSHVVLYDKPIRHYILSTGLSYLYMQKNGYEYSLGEVTGEDTLYSQLPRCTITTGSLSVDKGDLTQPFARGMYERNEEGSLKTFNSEIRRLPVTWSVNLKYSLSNFNESLVLVEEIMNNLIWQKYFNISYLGQVIQCSIEFPDQFNIEFNQPDETSLDSRNKVIQFDLTVKTNYPQINIRTEIDASKVINGLTVNVNPHSPTLITRLDDDNNQRIYK